LPLKIFGAIGLVAFLFLIVYVPVFFLVSVLHLTKAAMIPVVIVGSTIMAFAAVGVFAWRRKLRLADFGIRLSEFRYLVYALLVSMPLGVLSALGAARIHEPGPLQGVVLAPALTYLYFAIGAPVQEEFIFRGLLQTAMVDQLRNSAVASWAGVFAVLVVGLLFALIHFEVGPFTAACALVLALVAGEFRRRSSSLVPGIVCHAVFNLAAIVLG
jgi:membrane protease YdiL (CAAX protease family)